ncbi:MAG: class I SAM-dependent methyltransferase [Arenicellales bacterium]
MSNEKEPMSACKICGNKAGNAEYSVKEMLLGTRDVFKYIECGKCGCLQLKELPNDMSEYYPKNYYSFSQRKNLNWKAKINPRNRLKLLWKRSFFNGNKNLLFDSILSVLGEPGVPEWMRRTGIDVNSAILDIGCGDGKRLSEMSDVGFRNLTGIDQFMKFSNNKKENLRLLGCSIYELENNRKSYDLVMLHHSFEHMDDQCEVLKQISGKLKDSGCIAIIIPVKSSYAWEKYRTNWFSLDAPRHLFLHTLDSMKYLTEKSGLKIKSMYYDSSSQSLWGSEQYKQDIPMNSSKSYKNGLDNSIFNETDIEYFNNKAKELNASKEGDVICFIIEKIKNSY